MTITELTSRRIRILNHALPKLKLILGILLFPFMLFSQGSGNTVTFNGLNEFIDLGDQVGNGCRTIELWFKPSVNITSSLSSPKSLVIRDFNNSSGQNTDEFGLYFAPNNWGGGINAGKVMFMRRVGTTLIEIASDNNFWEAGHWYHICGTIDPASGMKLYVNGVLQQETHASNAPIGAQSGAQSDKVAIGKWGNVNIRYFNGEIDEVRFWETERSQQQVRDKMCSSLTGNEFGLRAYWNFDSGSGTTLLDNSTNNYNGTLQSMTNANWIYSGAPIGNISTHYYGNLTGSITSLTSGSGDALHVDNINSNADGVQIYKVNSLPNVTTNLNSPTTGNYYGVFLTSTSGTYNVSYDYNAYSCSNCDEIFARNDNAHLNWVSVGSSPQNCTFNLVNESSVGFDYRSEYIINTSPFIAPSNPLGNDTTLCSGNSLLLDPQVPNSTHLWQDNSSGSTFTVTQPGLYTVEVTSSCGTFIDSINVSYLQAPVVNLGNDTIICQSGSFILTPNLSSVNYQWQDNSSNPTYTVTQSGTYFVTASNTCGIDSDTIQIIYGTVPLLELGNDTILCEGETLLIDATNIFGSYIWQDGNTTSTYNVIQSGTYWVQVSNACGTVSDSIDVSFQSLPTLNLGNDTTLCAGNILVLSSSTSNNSITWQDGSTSPTFNVDNTGVFVGAITVNGCSTSDTIVVDYINPPVVDLGDDILMCEGDNLLLSTDAVGSHSWNTGSSEPSIVINSFGEYSVIVSNQCGQTQDSITIGDLDCSCTYYVPNSFTPDGGEFNEEFGMIYDCELTGFICRVFNRWGEIIFESHDPTEFWDGTYKNKLVPNGTYTYVIMFTTGDKNEKRLVGHVNVLY